MNRIPSWGIERNIVEVTEGPKIVLVILAGGTDPTDRLRDHETFERIMG